MNSCITQLKAQGPSRTGNESKEEDNGRALCTSNAGGRLCHTLRANRAGLDSEQNPTLEATQGQMNGFFSPIEMLPESGSICGRLN